MWVAVDGAVHRHWNQYLFLDYQLERIPPRLTFPKQTWKAQVIYQPFELMLMYYIKDHRHDYTDLIGAIDKIINQHTTITF